MTTMADDRHVFFAIVWRQPQRSVGGFGRAKTHREGATPDGRRKFGTVSGAILHVLWQAHDEMRVKAIRDEVERLLGGTVSRFPVSDYLLTRSSGPRPLFERTRHGHYRILRP
jgi:hypothetical protein